LIYDNDRAGALAAREAYFYDNRDGIYDIVRSVMSRAIGEFGRYAEMQRFFDPSAKHVLAYAPVPETVRLFERGAAAVTGIDISARELDRARRAIEAEGYARRFHGVVADAHKTPFDDASFDVIVGGSILHHLDLPVALDEIRRLLRPGGRAVFHEPLAHNPVLRLARALTPGARTPDEQPLTVDDLKLCREVFPDFEHHEFELLALLLVPLNFVAPRRWAKKVAGTIAALDDALLMAIPRLRRYARLTILVFK
jgi:SAM-dependent methyltransferase